MTPAMIERARTNALSGGYKNVEFHLSTIDKIPLPDASVDYVISNCVINLAPDKPAVFREIARVLKPGGRLAVSDIALKSELPPEVAASMAAYVGCIGGAILINDYRDGLLAGIRARQDRRQPRRSECLCQSREPSWLLLALYGFRRRCILLFNGYTCESASGPN